MCEDTSIGYCILHKIQLCNNQKPTDQKQLNLICRPSFGAHTCSGCPSQGEFINLFFLTTRMKIFTFATNCYETTKSNNTQVIVVETFRSSWGGIRTYVHTSSVVFFAVLNTHTKLPGTYTLTLNSAKLFGVWVFGCLYTKSQAFKRSCQTEFETWM